MNNYSEVAQYYDEITSTYFDYPRATTILKKLIKGKNVLEIGAGTGNLSTRLSQEGYSVTGIDSSESMLEMARKKQSRTHYSRQDVTSLKLDQEFDTAICFESVYVLIRQGDGYLMETYNQDTDEIRAGLENIHKHLKQYGLFLIDIRNERDESMRHPFRNDHIYRVKIENLTQDRLVIRHIIEKNNEVVAQSTINKYLVPLQEFEQMLRETGFEVLGFDDSDQFYRLQKA
jgi:SAM-dependent methyltransferase